MSNHSLNIADAIKHALQHHQAGRLQLAEHIYKSILKDDPDNPDANHLLGVLAYQVGKHDIAAQLISKAILKDASQAPYLNNLGLALQAQGKLEEALLAYQEATTIKPDYTDAHNNRGIVLQAQGRLEEALAAHQQVVAIKPDFAGGHNNRGIVLQAQGKLEEAMAAYQQALAVNPNYIDAHNNRGNLLQAQGKFEEALAAYQQALAINPDHADAHNNRGNALQAQGKFEEALVAYQQALAIKPDYAGAHYNRGVVLHTQGRLEEALAAYQQALAIKPDYADAHNNRGNALEAQGWLGEALESYQQAIAINPDHADAHNNQGVVLHTLGKFKEALAAFQQAIAINPDFADAHNNRGNALQAQTRIEEALAAYRQTIAIKPDFARAYSNLLFCLNYDANTDAQTLFAAHREWDARYAAGLSDGTPPHTNTPDPERRLRIGYMSPDFYKHPVASFVEPLLATHDRRAFEVVCYSNVTRLDVVTERLQKLADKWHSIVGMSDKRVAELVREDGIDILVDLAGHTAGNRLLVFARKPAPVQVTYLGYPGTSGLSVMDYRLSDAWTDPPGLTDAFYTEEIVRLPEGCLCFQPLVPSPEVTTLRDLSPGSVTFSSFNNAAKVTPAVISLWSKVLQAVPDARLMMKAKQLGDRETVERLTSLFERHGVTAERLEFVSWAPGSEEHLALYNRVHIGLDTFPYSGCTTTCEALWMGVPVIVLKGNESRSRMSLSILKQVGLDDYIAESPEAYIDIAKDLATDISKLQMVRSGLREKMKQSSLLDAAAFTHAVESAFRDLWKRWCEELS